MLVRNLKHWQHYSLAEGIRHSHCPQVFEVLERSTKAQQEAFSMDKVHRNISLSHIHYKKGKENGMVDALFWRHTLLTLLHVHLIGFEMLKDLYASDDDFKDVFYSCVTAPMTVFSARWLLF